MAETQKKNASVALGNAPGSAIDIRQVLQLAEQAVREPIIELKDGSRRRFLYDDAKRVYDEVEPSAEFPREVRTVGDIQSLVELVKAESARIMELNKGDFATASFTPSGGVVWLEEDQGRLGMAVKYERQPSFALNRVQAELGRWLDHESFLLLLATLAPWMVNGKRVLQAFRRVSTETTSGMSSQPFLDEGTTGLSYKVDVKVRGENVQADLPATLVLNIPFTLRQPGTYAIELWVDIKGERDEDSDKPIYVPFFRLLAPELAAIKERALEDELSFFREAMAKVLPNMPIVREK